MKTILHKAESRGHANHGWLDSYHTFSFSRYYNPERVHFGALRVLNDDTVAPGMGFGTHPHDNMEIVSIPLSGDLSHRDSTGRQEVIRQGDVQIMSAGSGLTHSEMNANRDKEVKFLQIWVLPKELNITPRYQQISFPLAERQGRWQNVVAPDNEQAVWINQDAWFTLGHFTAGSKTRYDWHKEGSGVYAFVIDGEVKIGDLVLSKRDGLGITEASSLDIEFTQEGELLLIEVPMLSL